MIRRIALCLAIGLGAFPLVVHGATGAIVEDVPIDSWVYQALFELSSQGHVPTLLLHTQPYTRGEVALAVEAMRQERNLFAVGERIVLSRLEAEFAEELADNAKRKTGQLIRLGGGPTAHSDQFKHGFTKNRIGADAIGSITLSQTAAVRWRVRLDSDGRFDSQFHGEYWKEKFTAWVEQAVFSAQWRRVHLAFGREYWRWGRSPRDVMLLSDHSPPFDGLRAGYRGGKWSFSFHVTMLDSMNVTESDYLGPDGPTGTANRYLVAHRIDWRPRDNFEIALSEVMLFGGVDRPWALNYLNPFVPYYWEQLNSHTNDNPLWSVEMSWRPRRGLELYGEWLLDDFQIDFTSEPQQIGVLGGLAWTPEFAESRLFFNGEYQRINTTVYGQDRPWNRYFHYRDINGNAVGIGSSLGPDADRFYFRTTCHVSPLLDVMGTIESIRRGEGRIDRPQESGVPKGLPFPSGIIEHETNLSAGLQLQYRGNLSATGEVGYANVANAGHVKDFDRNGSFVRIKVAALMWRTFGI